VEKNMVTTPNSDETIVLGHCPDCGPDRRADVLAEHKFESNDEEHGIWGRRTFRILRCRGCEAAYFQYVEIFSEDVDYRRVPSTGQIEPFIPERISHWPAPTKRNQPDWSQRLDRIDRNLSSLFDDIYIAMNNDLRIMAVIGVRTVFDRASELLGVDAGLTFAEKITALESAGRISNDEKVVIEVLIDAGNAAAHRGWKPTPTELNNIMSILESFLYRAFIAGDDAQGIKASVPPRPPRRPPTP
jgi:hypothetical protein